MFVTLVESLAGQWTTFDNVLCQALRNNGNKPVFFLVMRVILSRLRLLV